MPMEDKRIIKTKNNLKNTLIEMMQTVPFERITVSDLCRVGNTSRITFYTYYSDKYALANDLINDFVNECKEDYYFMQRKYNPDNDAIQGYIHLLESILDLCNNNINFFNHLSVQENPYVFAIFFSHICDAVTDYMARHTKLTPKYSLQDTAILICNGFWGVIANAFTEKIPFDEVRHELIGMYKSMLFSDLFIMKD